MLAHSAPLPLIIDDRGRTRGSTNYKEGIKLALQRRDRVRCIRLVMPLQGMQEVIAALDGEYPILSSLYIELSASMGVGLTPTPPQTVGLCASDKFSIAHNCHRPRHSLSCLAPPIRLPLSRSFASSAFARAPARDPLGHHLPLPS